VLEINLFLHPKAWIRGGNLMVAVPSSRFHVPRNKYTIGRPFMNFAFIFHKGGQEWVRYKAAGRRKPEAYMAHTPRICDD